MRKVTLAATQMSCSWDKNDNIAKAEALVRKAAAKGANVILIQELFETPYFCIEQAHKHFDLATTASENPAIRHFSNIASELGVVLPISFFERAGQSFFNSLAMIDADGTILGTYRKSHIPNDVAYQEKQFFSPGDTGFQVWETAFGRIGCGICWDQWFPETARCLVLKGAEILLFPTAIGSEPWRPDANCISHWQTVMQGHAGANLVPVVASNRVGTEVATEDENLKLEFFGGSFIANQFGQRVADARNEDGAVITATFDLDEIAENRRYWGVFRDRRPDLYGAISTLDGVERP
ncbi:N-carbamoylputrescine amidase [Parasedimentitalea psychrophila]|uniref:N-carbamoylputrescine amidase n=2 Tax=Parasedimentitalea psychrophila TaxID=2997337 RepID=A0A9Y2P4Y8_9RHOB|nr:N-carbamoylputrescine amidase [Parasedimentitalea psychrophila]WIY27422.1 N-carbamoylputrescine amidase [Parasedimentitalea psychrophila]